MLTSGVAVTGTAPVVPALSVVTISPGVLACAVFTTLGNAAAPTLTLSVAVLESVPAIAPACVHVTTCAAAEQLQPLPLALAKPMPAGSVSTTVVVPVVATGTMLRTTRSNRPAPPTNSVPTRRFVNRRFGAADTGIAAVADVSLPRDRSPAVVAAARFTKLGAAATPTIALNRTESSALTASGAVRKQLTVAPATLHVKPPAGTVARNVSPAGSTSTTRTVSVVAAVPTFCTRSVKSAVSPTA